MDDKPVNIYVNDKQLLTEQIGMLPSERYYVESKKHAMFMLKSDEGDIKFYNSPTDQIFDEKFGFSLSGDAAIDAMLELDLSGEDPLTAYHRKLSGEKKRQEGFLLFYKVIYASAVEIAPLIFMFL